MWIPCIDFEQMKTYGILKEYIVMPNPHLPVIDNGPDEPLAPPPAATTPALTSVEAELFTALAQKRKVSYTKFLKAASGMLSRRPGTSGENTFIATFIIGDLMEKTSSAIPISRDLIRQTFLAVEERVLNTRLEPSRAAEPSDTLLAKEMKMMGKPVSHESSQAVWEEYGKFAAEFLNIYHLRLG